MQDLNHGDDDTKNAEIDEIKLKALRSLLAGAAIEPSAHNYDEVRSIWNAMIDRRPALIVRCGNTSDVQATLRFAIDNDLPIAVRGGGHNIAGNALCDGGVVIDFSQMRSVRVDTATRRAFAQPGATLADVDRATQEFGLAIPTGINSTTGIAGLTLGGGFGWLTRKFGLTIDSLVAAEIVMADTKHVRANATENQELFWALRGGGGNFGVVTEFEFQLSPVGPQVFSGLVVHPLDDAAEVLREYREIIKAAPDELTCWAVMRQAPPLPFLPEIWHGKGVLVFAMCYCGRETSGEQATANLRAIGKPVASHSGLTSYCDWQQAFDPLLTSGARNYWKSHDLIELTDDAIHVLVDAIRRVPEPECEIFIAHIGGAAARIEAGATAFPQRNSHFVMNVHGRWRDPSADEDCIGWVRGTFSKMEPHAAGTAYVNFMPDDESDRVATVYGGNYERLARAKRRYDPSNLFKANQNIQPA
jgi:FAD/FMN-containing dehydrogenase